VCRLQKRYKQGFEMMMGMTASGRWPAGNKTAASSETPSAPVSIAAAFAGRVCNAACCDHGYCTADSPAGTISMVVVSSLPL